MSKVRDAKAVGVVDDLSDGSIVVYLEDTDYELTEADLRESIDSAFAECGGYPLTAAEKAFVEACYADIDTLRGR